MEAADPKQRQDTKPLSATPPPSDRVEDTGIIDLYSYGFTNGLLKVDPDFFDHWVEAFDQERLYNLKLHALIKEKEQLQERLRQTEESRKELEKTIISNERSAQETNRKIAQTKQQADQQQKREETFERAIEANTPHYKLASVVLFILGALFFLMADVLFSQNVLTNVLDLPGWEAWILAIAVGALTLAVKPTVDRFFEQPYIKGENKKRNYIFLITVSLLILTALGLLGAYRNQAQHYTEQYVDLETKIQDIDNKEARGEALTVEDMKDKEDLQAEKRKLDRQLYLDPRITTGFILISILFAVAGAICLSIGLPAGSQLIVRQRHRKELKQMLQQLEALKAFLNQLYEQLTEQETAAQIARKELSHLPEPGDLRAEERSLTQKEELLLEERARQKEQRHKQWYKLGYLRGRQYQLSDKLVVHPSVLGSVFHRPARSGSKNSRGSRHHKEGKTSPQASNDRSTNYLHEQLREMIDYNFNKQQNLNGKHED